jgi:hypothetical protein
MLLHNRKVEQVGVLFQKEQQVLSGPQRCLPMDQRVDTSEMETEYPGEGRKKERKYH